MTHAEPKSPPPLILPARVTAQIVAAARRAAPAEACGLLVGRPSAAGNQVVRQASARNRHPQPLARFELASEDFLAAEKRARAQGQAVLGFWHSHPASAARPSAVDRAAAWEDTSYLIVSLAGAVPEIRSWRLLAGTWVEEEIFATAPGCEAGG